MTIRQPIVDILRVLLMCHLWTALFLSDVGHALKWRTEINLNNNYKKIEIRVKYTFLLARSDN